MAENILCVIPARAGSKRLLDKNLLPLAGKPMLAYTVEAALQCGLFEEVYVGTEDARIAEVAKEYGAQVPLLMPPQLCEDHVASHEPCLHLAAYLEDHGNSFDIIVCLQPTSPLRTADDLIAAIDRFLLGDLDFLVSVTAIDPHYFHWVVEQQDDGYWRMHFGDQYLAERSMLPQVFRPNGSIKIARLAKLREVGHFFGPRLGVLETPEEHSVHVGTRFDFKFCEFLLKEKSR